MDFSGTNEASFSISSQFDAATTKSAAIVLNRSTLASSVANLSRVTPTELVAAINAQIAASGEANLKGKVRVGRGVDGSLYVETTAFTSLGADGAAGGTGAYADTSYPAGGRDRTVAIRNLSLSGPGQTAVNVGFGTDLPPDMKAKTVTDAYLRQSLETDASTARAWRAAPGSRCSPSRSAARSPRPAESASPACSRLPVRPRPARRRRPNSRALPDEADPC